MEPGTVQTVTLVCAGVAVALALLLVLLTAHSRRAAREEAAALHRRIAELEASRVQDVHDARTAAVARASEVTPTEPLGRSDEPVEVTATLPAPVFTDMVLRESVIRLASLTHGVRRALRPEQRHRVRFEVRRETKRARKQRRAETRAAVREHQARARHHAAREDAA